MGTIADKITYTYEAIEDIRAALRSKGIDITNIPLKNYGNLIRSLNTSDEVISSTIDFVDYNRITNDYYTSKAIDNIENIQLSSDIFFVDYKSSTNDYNNPMMINTIENVLTSSDFVFTDNIVEVKM